MILRSYIDDSDVGQGAFSILAGWIGPVHGISIEELNTHFVTAMVAQGPLRRQQVSKYKALISFHKQHKNMSGLIRSWNPSTGVYRIIYIAEMARAPKLHVQFADPQYSVELVKSTPADTCFKVKGKVGYIVDRQVEIIGLSLDAEL